MAPTNEELTFAVLAVSLEEEPTTEAAQLGHGDVGECLALCILMRSFQERTFCVGAIPPSRKCCLGSASRLRCYATLLHSLASFALTSSRTWSISSNSFSMSAPPSDLSSGYTSWSANTLRMQASTYSGVVEVRRQGSIYDIYQQLTFEPRPQSGRMCHVYDVLDLFVELRSLLKESAYGKPLFVNDYVGYLS